jgi:nucleotide-binding universal stress UspA family protein
MNGATSSEPYGDHRSGPIVVGVDGSPAGQHALEWAVQEAEAKGTTILAISTYQNPTLASAAPYAGWSPALLEELADQAQKILTDGVAAVTKEHPKVEIETKVVEGSAASVLLEASKQASALVVGSRGHGGMVGTLLGSVSHRCVAHAHCPVVVVGAGAHVEELHAPSAKPSAGINWSPP